MSDVREEILDITAELVKKIPQLYQLGKTDEHNSFWSGALKNTSSFIGRCAGRCWTPETFKPNADINLTSNCNHAFYNHGSGANLQELAQTLGITITMKPSYAQYMFQFSNLKNTGVIDLTDCQSLVYTFANTSALEEISLKLKDDGTTPFSSNTFEDTTGLKRLNIVSGMIKKSINLQWSKNLEPSCLEDIIRNKLYNFNEDGLGESATFKISEESWNALDDYSPNPEMMGNWKTWLQAIKGWQT